MRALAASEMTNWWNRRASARIASATGHGQLGEPPANAGFPGERPPWTSALTSIRTGSTSPVNRDSEHKTDDGSNYGTKE